MLQAGIETQLTLEQYGDFYPRANVIPSLSKGIFYLCIFTYMLVTAGELNL